MRQKGVASMLRLALHALAAAARVEFGGTTVAVSSGMISAVAVEERLKTDDHHRGSELGTTLDFHPRISPDIVLIGVGARHNRSDGPPTPYMFASRSAAAAACRRTGDYSRLCNKAELLGFSTCANGWCADWEGFWIVSNFRTCPQHAL